MMVNGSPGSSISGDMDVMSDPGDPIHSESILQELFYKNLLKNIGFHISIVVYILTLCIQAGLQSLS
jgi:hypothetical protein